MFLPAIEMRIGTDGPWTEMKWVERKDPYYEDLRAREEVETLQNQLYDRLHELMGRPKVQHDFTLEEAILSQHIWQAKMPTDIPVGTHTIHHSPSIIPSPRPLPPDLVAKN